MYCNTDRLIQARQTWITEKQIEGIACYSNWQVIPSKYPALFENRPAAGMIPAGSLRAICYGSGRGAIFFFLLRRGRFFEIESCCSWVLNIWEFSS